MTNKYFKISLKSYIVIVYTCTYTYKSAYIYIKQKNNWNPVFTQYSYVYMHNESVIYNESPASMGPNPVVRQNVQIWVMLGYRHEMFGYRDDLLGSRHERVTSELAGSVIELKVTSEW